MSEYLYILGIADSPLCRGYMEEYETQEHVIFNFKGVSDQRNAHVGSPATLLEALGNLDVVYGL